MPLPYQEGALTLFHFALLAFSLRSIKCIKYRHGTSPEETPPLISTSFFLPQCLGKTSFKRACKGAHQTACEGARRRAHDEGAHEGTIQGATERALYVRKACDQGPTQGAT